MKALGYIILFSTLTFSCVAQTKKERQLEKQKPQSVKILPNDSMRHNMPVQKTDTYRNNMPVIDSDTSRVVPK